MTKYSVNLVINKSAESPLVAKAKIFLPVTAIVSLALFVIFFLSSLVYINKNNQKFNALKIQIDNLEKRISANKNAEGVYVLTVSRIKTIDQLGTHSKKFTPLLSEILKMQSGGLVISQATIDKKNAVTVALTASSSGTLDEFVTALMKAESNKLFSDIKSSGIVRDKDGSYLLSVSLNPNPTLFQ